MADTYRVQAISSKLQPASLSCPAPITVTATNVTTPGFASTQFVSCELDPDDYDDAAAIIAAVDTTATGLGLEVDWDL